MSDERRRASDGFPIDLDQMILDETDKTHRAFLMAFNSINNNMNAMTRMIGEVTDKLSTHLDVYAADKKERDIAIAAEKTERMAILNRGRGWRDLAVPFILVLQIVATGACALIYDDYKHIKEQLVTNTERHADFDARVKALEKAEALEHEALVAKRSKGE